MKTVNLCESTYGTEWACIRQSNLLSANMEVAEGGNDDGDTEDARKDSKLGRGSESAHSASSDDSADSEEHRSSGGTVAVTESLVTATAIRV